MQETTHNISSEKKKRELISILNSFYANPVARASTELFLTLGLVLFLGVFAIRPTIVTMSDLLKEIETKQKLDKDLTNKIAALQTAQTEYLNIEQSLPLLNSAIPEQPEIIQSAKLVEKIASDTQVVIKSLSISQLPDDIDPNLPFSLKAKQNLNIITSITGDYLSIRNFVETLRNSRKSFLVESIVFALEEDRGSKKLNANLTIVAPFFGLSQTEDEVKSR